MTDITGVGFLTSMNSIVSCETRWHSKAFSALVTFIRFFLIPIVGMDLQVGRIAHGIWELLFAESAYVGVQISIIYCSRVSHSWQERMRRVVEVVDELLRQLLLNHDTRSAMKAFLGVPVVLLGFPCLGVCERREM